MLCLGSTDSAIKLGREHSYSTAKRVGNLTIETLCRWKVGGGTWTCVEVLSRVSRRVENYFYASYRKRERDKYYMCWMSGFSNTREKFGVYFSTKIFPKASIVGYRCVNEYTRSQICWFSINARYTVSRESLHLRMKMKNGEKEDSKEWFLRTLIHLLN